MDSTFGICNLPLVPVRAEASDKSEMISQLLFGDLLRIIMQEEKWAMVQNIADDYIGWIDRKQFSMINYDDFSGWAGDYVAGTGISVAVKKGETDESLLLVPGSALPVGGGQAFAINGQEYVAPANVILPDSAAFYNLVEPVAKSFLNAPYLWGGRSPLGIDCSGFCQVVFKILGIRLPRDSSQQALKGDVVHFLSESKPGDLAFFDNGEGKIIHVGLLLDNSTIIHASGRVKIDTIDSQGIYSHEFGRHTHKLRIIRRYV